MDSSSSNLAVYSLLSAVATASPLGAFDGKPVFVKIGDIFYPFTIWLISCENSCYLLASVRVDLRDGSARSKGPLLMLSSDGISLFGCLPMFCGIFESIFILLENEDTSADLSLSDGLVFKFN